MDAERPRRTSRRIEEGSQQRWVGMEGEEDMLAAETLEEEKVANTEEVGLVAGVDRVLGSGQRRRDTGREPRRKRTTWQTG